MFMVFSSKCSPRPEFSSPPSLQIKPHPSNKQQQKTENLAQGWSDGGSPAGKPLITQLSHQMVAIDLRTIVCPDGGETPAISRQPSGVAVRACLEQRPIVSLEKLVMKKGK